MSKRKGLEAKAETYERRVEKYTTEQKKHKRRRHKEHKKKLVLDEQLEMKTLQLESALSKHVSDHPVQHVTELELKYAEEHEATPFVDVVTVAQPFDAMDQHTAYDKVGNVNSDLPLNVFGIGGLDILETFLTAYKDLRDKTYVRDGHEVRDIPQVGRRVYQSMLFVPHGNALQACSNGSLCVANQLHGAFLGGPLMRYHTPDEMEILRQGGTPPVKDWTCRLCEIYTIQSLLLKNNMQIYNVTQQLGRSIPKVGVGEYDECCLLKPAQNMNHGIFGPQLSFNANDYKPVFGITSLTNPTTVSGFVELDKKLEYLKKWPNSILVPGLRDCSPGLLNPVSYVSSLTGVPPPIDPYTVTVREPEQPMTPAYAVFLHFRGRGYHNVALVFKCHDLLMEESKAALEHCYDYLVEEKIVNLERFGCHREKAQLDFDSFKFYITAFLAVSVYCDANEKHVSKTALVLRSLPEYVMQHIATIYKQYVPFFTYVRELGHIPSDHVLKCTYGENGRSLFVNFTPRFTDYFVNLQEFIGMNVVETTCKNATPLEKLLQFYKVDERETLHAGLPADWSRATIVSFLKTGEFYHRGIALLNMTRPNAQAFVDAENKRYAYLREELPLVLDEFEETLLFLQQNRSVRERALRRFNLLSVLPVSMQGYCQDQDDAFWDKHFILFTLVYRVFVCQDMYRLEKRQFNKVRQAWLLFMNSHLDLCLYMMNCEDMSDRKLTDRNDAFVDRTGDTARPPDFNSPYRYYYPYSYRERTPGDMPNYISRLNRVTWSNVQQLSKKISFEAVMFKIPRRCCDNRDLNKHLIEACHESIELRDYILRSLSLSMKGLYEWCVNAPTFPNMLEIHAVFEHHHVPGNYDRALRFISNCTYKPNTNKTKEYLYQNLCTNAMAENMYYMLRFNLPLMNILKQLYPTWFFDDVIELMNLVRMQDDFSVEAVSRVFKSLKREDKTVYRFVHQSFIQFYQKCAHEFPPSISTREKTRHFTFNEQKQMINFIVDRMPLDYSSIDFNSFALLGCSSRSIEVLIRIHLKHQSILENRSSTDSKQTQNLELRNLFSKIELNDRHAFDCFFSTVLKRKNVTMIKIQSDWFVTKQVEQLEKNFGKVITEPMMSLAIAPCCDSSIRTMCPETSDTPTVGTKNTAYDLGSLKVICDKKKCEVKEEIHFYSTIGNVVQIKRPIANITKEKKRRPPPTNNKNKPKLPKPKLASPITLQPCCATLNKLETESFSPSGEFLCENCRKKSQAHQSFVSPTCLSCEHLIGKNGFVSLPKRYICDNCYKVNTTAECGKCSCTKARFILPATGEAQFLVVMDQNASHRIIWAYFCKTCYAPWQGYNLLTYLHSALKIVSKMDSSATKKDMVERFCRGL